jgi:hypothetical protein
MQRLGNRHELRGIVEEHERGAMGDAEVNRAERVLDGHLVLVRPSEEAGEEAAERGLVALGVARLRHHEPPIRALLGELEEVSQPPQLRRARR